MKLTEVIGAIVFFLMSISLSTFIDGFVASHVWNLIMPKVVEGITVISIWQAAGIKLLIGAFLPAKKNPEELKDKELISYILTSMLQQVAIGMIIIALAHFVVAFI